VTVALVAVIALVAAVVQASTGLGFALVLGPACFAVLDPKQAIVAITVLGLALNLLVLFAERRRPAVVWPEVGPILAAAVPGAVCGIFILRALPKATLQVVVGLAVIVAALLRAAGSRRAAATVPGDPRARLALGFATGTLTTSAGVNGPPMALWFTRRGMGPAQVRDSLSAAFLGLGVIGALVLAPVLAVAGERLDLATLAAGMACVVLGHAIGSRAFARLEGRHYEPILLTLIVAAGAASVAAGLL
jgi:uncharacterized protein